jgi:LPXTG-motif cell wall-anchored protein
VCTFTSQFGPLEKFDLPYFFLENVAGATAGAAGSFTVTLSSTTDDPDTSNNTVKADVALTAAGVDVKAIVPFDIVYFEQNSYRPVYPGEETFFYGLVWNQGSKTSQGAKALITLPEGVTFIHTELAGDECQFSDGNRKVLCTSDEVVLPANGSYDNEASVIEVVFPVKVSADVAGPVNLPGGLFTFEALGVADPAPDAQVRSSSKVFKAGGQAIAPLKDVDASDNSDEFIAYVGKPGGQGGGLPTTGANVALIGGAGAAVLVLGAVLFLLTRRRRVVE